MGKGQEGTSTKSARLRSAGQPSGQSLLEVANRVYLMRLNQATSGSGGATPVSLGFRCVDLSLEATLQATQTLAEDSGALSLSSSAETTQAGGKFMRLYKCARACTVRVKSVFPISVVSVLVTKRTRMTVTGRGFQLFLKATERV